MKCLVVADIHYALRQYDWLLKQARDFPVIIIAGDLLDLSSASSKQVQKIAVLKYLKRLAATTRVLASSGNHDLDDTLPSGEAIADWLQIARRNGVYIDGDTLDVEDSRFSICPWWDGPAMQRQVAEQLSADAANRPEHWIWIYHAPPAGSSTAFTRKGNIGDPFLLEQMERHEPDLVLCGHIHDSPFYAGGSWYDRIGPTWVMNAGKQIGPEPTHIELDLTTWTAVWRSIEGKGVIELSKSIDIAVTQS